MDFGIPQINGHSQNHSLEHFSLILPKWNQEWSNQSLTDNLMSMVVSEARVDGEKILLARVIADPVYLMDVSYLSTYAVNFDGFHSGDLSYYFDITYEDLGDVARLSAPATSWTDAIPSWNFGTNSLFDDDSQDESFKVNAVDINKYSLWVAASVNSGVIRIANLTDLKLTSFASAYALSPDCTVSSYQADGYCDPVNNVESCDWDGGDCCQSTCGVDYVESYPCGSDGYSCLNPDASDFGESTVPTDPEYTDDLVYYGGYYYDDGAIFDSSYIPKQKLVAYVL
jgi:hypothetical protein